MRSILWVDGFADLSELDLRARRWYRGLSIVVLVTLVLAILSYVFAWTVGSEGAFVRSLLPPLGYLEELPWTIGGIAASGILVTVALNCLVWKKTIRQVAHGTYRAAEVIPLRVVTLAVFSPVVAFLLGLMFIFGFQAVFVLVPIAIIIWLVRMILFRPE